MDIPITNPKLTSNINDHSCVDDSIRQDGVTINAGNGSVINSNSGNGKSEKKMSALFQILAVSIICDLLICGLVLFNGNGINERIEKRNVEFIKAVQNQNTDFEKMMENNHREWQTMMNESNAKHEKMMEQAKEGTIWILRNDILKSIDIYEAKGTITAFEYRWLKEEFEHYKEIGGNHDVKERFDSFTAKIYGTGEIKMVK